MQRRLNLVLLRLAPLLKCPKGQDSGEEEVSLVLVFVLINLFFLVCTCKEAYIHILTIKQRILFHILPRALSLVSRPGLTRRSERVSSQPLRVVSSSCV